MKLQGRSLSIQMQGDDVALLQLELRHISFDISSDEVESKLIGHATRRAAANFQQTQNLHTGNGIERGVVDEHTAELINREYDGRKTSVVKGTVLHVNGDPAIDTLLRVFDH